MRRHPAEVVHGNRAEYGRGCRCADCTVANAVYAAGYRQRRLADGTVRILHGRFLANRGGADAGDGAGVAQLADADEDRGEGNDGGNES